MIAFGCSITSPETYDRCAGPGIELAAEPGSAVFADAAAGSLFRTYNLILERAAAHDDLEALVLVHQDAEIVDPQFAAKVRATLQDPEVGVAGCVGAVGVRSIAWWEGSLTWASAVYRYGELGADEVSPLARNGDAAHATTGEVDTLVGIMLVLSPWTVRNLRFDETLGRLHGYDFDLCQQVRAAGRKVVTADFEVVHHHALQLVAEPEPWAVAHARVAEKWEGRLPGAAGDPATVPATADWRARARRAEAESAAARLLAASRLLQAQARAQYQDERLRAIAASASWRITEPLRKLNAARTGRRAARRAQP